MKHIKTFDQLFEELRPDMMATADGTMKRISKQTAIDKKMFGPVYHGSDQDTHKLVGKEGFKIFIGNTGSPNVKNGYYGGANYGNLREIPPIHHLGFGVYFTQSKTSAKKYNQGTSKGLKEYYLDVPRLLTINWGSENTMMKWWKSMGYDTDLARTDRVKATKQLTDRLAQDYDAVLYQGKSMMSLLDGNQIVVFDTNRIYEIDNSLSGDLEVGSKVVFVENVMQHAYSVSGEYQPYVTIAKGQTGIITNRIPTSEYPPHAEWTKGSKYVYWVKLTNKGTHHNILDRHIAPYKK